MPNYGDKRYWDKRYNSKKDTVFEWLEQFKDLEHLIEMYCQKDAAILNLGCGNSIIQEDMYDAGYQNITNIDISPVCIEQMIKRKGDRHKLIYQVMDCTDLKYEDESFDFVFDKSTIDALLCGNDSYLNVAKMLSEVQRILKEGGIYFIVSYGEPYNRTFHFEREHIDFQYTYLALPPKDAEDGSGKKQNPHYVYILKKGPKAAQKYFDNYESVILELIQEEEESRLKFGSQEISDNEDDSQESENTSEEEEQEEQEEEEEEKLNKLEEMSSLKDENEKVQQNDINKQKVLEVSPSINEDLQK